MEEVVASFDCRANPMRNWYMVLAVNALVRSLVRATLPASLVLGRHRVRCDRYLLSGNLRYTIRLRPKWGVNLKKRGAW